MRATLIVNPNAGGARRVRLEDLAAALEAAGYHPVVETTTDEQDLDRVLAEPEGLVVAAGGDGTLRAVAQRMVGKRAPLALVPMGTANNIGRTLGLDGEPADLLRALDAPRRQPFDLGRVTASWGSGLFLEACGYGLYADVLAAYDPEAGKSVTRALASLVTTLSGYQGRPYALRLDGEDLSDEYLMVEVLNTCATGPRLQLAPGADPGDGLLDVVLIRDDNRARLLDYARALLAGELAGLDSVEVRRVRRLEVDGDGAPMHLDGEVRGGGEDRQSARIEVVPGALELWLPAVKREEER
ncbi:diacylglycerol kinase family enzyme [Deinobacterium chartae]|uniref:Diacylglycerol kinase family enzyme n=1 Tax=Deinobacterium chartae TaxID=521158 RepID=A0A841I3W8_9DEIO|nr:diacylglycerol kinase family enzyme [Deinobacterium chartae]